MIQIFSKPFPGLLIPAIGSAFLLSSCFPSLETQEDAQETESKHLSVSRSIVDAQGRSLEVTIIGRSADSITFVRASDQQRFTIPVTNLSKEDQTFVAGLPMAAPPPDKQSSPDEELRNASGPLGFALDRKKEILKKIDLIDKEIPKFPKAPSKVNSLNRERGKLEDELIAVETEIKSLRSK